MVSVFRYTVASTCWYSAGGFTGSRETATKTNSLVDRLRKLTLPAVDDVRDGLASYMETVERADELEVKIERTDELIDEIVYELYGLTDEEIEIVEEAIGGERVARQLQL
ncbi:restriction endonuclease [Haloarcula sp. S1AR25-5A]|uniref:Restriction endonuclease n=1 Tax=Haloarcula terrestris TaxID=2950533 RepID=A0AAE4F134_9EURY|nr:restriction endonuclease [Haloarcula terrestris]MDS0223632.1 restriction endonuclease [Haloarcula terrestris]